VVEPGYESKQDKLKEVGGNHADQSFGKGLGKGCCREKEQHGERQDQCEQRKGSHCIEKWHNQDVVTFKNLESPYRF
jgi:hypothetical protein